jgi:hypothetical protein
MRRGWATVTLGGGGGGACFAGWQAVKAARGSSQGNSWTVFFVFMAKKRTQRMQFR